MITNLNGFWDLYYTRKNNSKITYRTKEHEENTDTHRHTAFLTFLNEVTRSEIEEDRKPIAKLPPRIVAATVATMRKPWETPPVDILYNFSKSFYLPKEKEAGVGGNANQM